ncbi:exonuclease, partial [Escherichia coli]|nr:exonuclease [Escherichia coli]
MSKVFICAAIPDEQAIKEEGAAAVATAIEAGDERRARAKFHWQFLEHYPAAQDCAYKFLVCEDKPGIPRPALDSWDAEYMQENRWDEESASFVPVETESDPMNVTFDKLAPEVQNAVMVKFDTCENITVDMVISAQELLQEDMATFDGHIVEALMKMPEVNAMYPELKLHAIGWVKHKCNPGAKWPEIQAEMRIWKKRREGERKETGKYTSVVDLARARVNRQHTENSAEKIPLSLQSFVANISRHGKHWMMNWPMLCGLVTLMPETLTAASIAGQKMKLSTTTAKTGSVSRHQCANSLMP